MKQVMLIVLALLTIVGWLPAQWVEGSHTITCNLWNKDSVTVYCVRSFTGDTDLDSTLTVLSDVQPGRLIPPIGVVIEPNALTGTVAGETDSLLVRVYPIVYDWYDGEYAVILDNFRYASFGQVGELVTARTALDWDDGAEYYISLDDISTTNPFSECGGVAIEVINRNAAGGKASCMVQPVYKYYTKQ